MEIWKDIPGYDGMYQVSNHGHVRSWKRHKGRPGKREEPLILKLTTSSSGYHKVNLWKGGERTTKEVHRLVAEAFIPNPEDKEYTNHKDGRKLNNYWWNLEWVTPSENLVHAFENELRNRGSMSKAEAKIFKSQLMADDPPVEKICEDFDITEKYAQRIIEERVWAGL